jgi:hypothetical protein
MKRVVVNPTSRRLHRGKSKVVCLTSIIAAALCFMASDLVGQDPFAIRTETDLVLVPTVVREKNQVRSVSKSMSDCFEANGRVFSHLSSSDSYLPKDCDNTGIPTLTAKDFSVFDDGVERQVYIIVSRKQSALRGGSFTSVQTCLLARVTLQWADLPS